MVCHLQRELEEPAESNFFFFFLLISFIHFLNIPKVVFRSIYKKIIIADNPGLKIRLQSLESNSNKRESFNH